MKIKTVVFISERRYWNIMRHESFYTEFIHDVIHRRICLKCLVAKSFPETHFLYKSDRKPRASGGRYWHLDRFKAHIQGYPGCHIRRKPTDPIHEHIQVKANLQTKEFCWKFFFNSTYSSGVLRIVPLGWILNETPCHLIHNY